MRLRSRRTRQGFSGVTGKQKKAVGGEGNGNKTAMGYARMIAYHRQLTVVASKCDLRH
jgi:hypothetical protein